MHPEPQAEKPTLELLEWRVRQLEAIETALRVEIHDLRIELQTMLRGSYLTVSEMRNKFITREEVEESRAIHREWPVVIFTGLMCLCNIITLVVVVHQGH